MHTPQHPNTHRGAIVAECRGDSYDLSEACAPERPEDSCSIVILGGSGDLTARKLIPALFHLFLNRGLPRRFNIVGCGRSPLDHDHFRSGLEAATQPADAPAWETFAARLFYQVIAYESPASYERLGRFLSALEQEAAVAGNRIFYLALPPSLYRPVSAMLGQAGLSAEGRNKNGWARLVVEKPFGRNLATAVDLDRSIHQSFKEHQVFRMDHYLAKETVQNILMFRFANTIFEPLWNRRYIDHVCITATEALGVGHRAGYYEEAGVLRDMFQNHMMQLLALTAMEPPSAFEADRVHDEKAKVYRSLRPFPVADLRDYLVLGQYAAGAADGQAVCAYRDEPGVKHDSMVPTFAAMKVLIDNWRWQGVPFYLTSGKRLARKKTEITVQFKEVPHSMFRRTLGRDIIANRLTLGVYPDEKITLTFQTKTPGSRVRLRSVTMDFNYYQKAQGPVLEAYEKILADCMLGDQMLFWRQDSVELCWSFLTPILEGCETCGDRAAMLHAYPAGSGGPAEAQRIMGKHA